MAFYVVFLLHLSAAVSTMTVHTLWFYCMEIFRLLVIQALDCTQVHGNREGLVFP